MKKIFHNSEFRFLLDQVLLFLLFAGMWGLMLFRVEQNTDAAWESFSLNTWTFLTEWFLFALNYYLLVPKLYESKKHSTIKLWIFWIVNLIIIIHPSIIVNDNVAHTVEVKWDGGIEFDGSQVVWNEATRITYYLILAIKAIIGYAMVGLAIGRRYYLHQRKVKQQLADLTAKNNEAELNWLKNQLNPHFLFNTLNNISSLIQIDPDTAQDKVGQLSDLLRYALYETKDKTVALGGELEFMTNYIELMSLRCDTNVNIKTDFKAENNSFPVAPMLFLSPIENAFKHGVSSNRPSFIHISLNEKDGHIYFECLNSNYPKDSKNRSGSGIGKVNMARRLELLYPDCHKLEQGLDGETYYVKIELWNI